MEPLDARIEAAQALWARGAQAERMGDLAAAHACYTQAHDRVMDCARLHQRAHEQLRRVNLRSGRYGELLTDWLLHLLAPLGVFELVSYFARTQAFGAAVCARQG